MTIKARKFFQFHRYPRTTNWVRCLNTSATATSVLIVSHRKLFFKATHAQFNLREPRKAAIIMDNQPDLEPNQPKLWELRLYVAGQTPKAIAAFINLKKVCEQYLEGQYQIEIIDLLNDPKLGQQDHIFALPTLVRKIPRPLKQIIGDLSSPEKILVGLELWRGEGRGKKSLI